MDTPEKLEEERRLAYVSYTRAEKGLFLSDAEGINFDGSFRYPSRFIFNTEKEYLHYVVELEERLAAQAAGYICANEEKICGRKQSFQTGDIVVHKVFGRGQIVAVKEEISSYVIQFEGMETVRNISMRIPLEKGEPASGLSDVQG